MEEAEDGEHQDYKLKIEYVDSTDIYNDEQEFQEFCASIVSDLNATNPNYEGEWAKITRDAARKIRRHRFSENSSSNSSLSSAGEATTRRARVKRVRPSVTDHRSFKSRHMIVAEDDIRLSYAQRFINVFNGIDKHNLKSNLELWCTSDCLFTVKWVGKHGNPCGPDQRAVQGAGPVTSFVDAIMVGAVPDAVMELLDSKLRVASNGESFLLCKYSFKGTQLSRIRPVAEGSAAFSVKANLNESKPQNEQSGSVLDTEPVMKRQRLSEADAAIRNSDMKEAVGLRRNTSDSSSKELTSTDDPNAATALINVSNTTTASEVGDVAQPIVRDFHTNDLLPSMVRMSIIGTLILHINAEKMISRFEFIQECVHLVTVERDEIFGKA